MQPKSPFLHFVVAALLVVVAFYVWQIPALKKAIGGTVKG